MRADAEGAFEAFLALVKDAGAKEYLRAQNGEILAVFRDSATENLRLLKHALWNFERLWPTLTAAQRSHQRATRELLALLCAATLELQSSRTSVEAFRRTGSGGILVAQAGDREPDTAAAERMVRRYPTVDFQNTPLSLETICGVVVEARVSAHDVQRQLRAHPYFAAPNEFPSWQALWHSRGLKQVDLDDVLSRFAQDFERRAFRSEPEILHVAGLCLWLADIGQPGWDAGDVVDRVKAYIDDAHQASEADADEPKSAKLGMPPYSAFGLGFHNSDDPSFAEISRHLAAAVDARRLRSYPKVADRLKRLVKEDSEAFLRDVCFTDAGPATYARFAVLSRIPAAEFAEVFAEAPHEDQHRVCMALHLRYEQAQHVAELRSELPWLADVHREVAALASSMPPIPRHHVHSLLKHYLSQHVPAQPQAPSSAPGPATSSS